MLLPCEVGVKTILPAIKAIMARSIMEKHGFTEKQTADLLGLSQSAVSRYVSRDRGNLIELEKSVPVSTPIEQMVMTLVKEPHKKKEIMNIFCQTCTEVRKQGLLCTLCQKEMPKEWAQTCTFCKDF